MAPLPVVMVHMLLPQTGDVRMLTLDGLAPRSPNVVEGMLDLFFLRWNHGTVASIGRTPTPCKTNRQFAVKLVAVDADTTSTQRRLWIDNVTN